MPVDIKTEEIIKNITKSLAEVYKSYSESIGDENTVNTSIFELNNLRSIAEDGIQWPNVLYDADLNDIVKSYDIMGYPTKYLIDQKGNIVSKILGNSPNNHDILIKKLDELLVWLVKGSIKYYKKGLGDPAKKIEKATKEYMDENDDIKDIRLIFYKRYMALIDLYLDINN